MEGKDAYPVFHLFNHKYLLSISNTPGMDLTNDDKTDKVSAHGTYILVGGNKLCTLNKEISKMSYDGKLR